MSIKEIINLIRNRPLMYVPINNFDSVVNFVAGVQYQKAITNTMEEIDKELRDNLHDYTFNWVCKNLDVNAKEDTWSVLMKEHTQSDAEALEFYYSICGKIFEDFENKNRSLSTAGEHIKESNYAGNHKVTYRPYEMLGDKIQTEEEILHRIYSSFQFPETYRETWEDIEAGLKDLSWTGLTHWELIVWNSGQLLTDQPEVKERFLHLVRDIVIPYWQEKEGYDFKISLQEGNDE